MLFAGNSRLYSMHSLETGVVVSLAAFFFFSFLTFTFLREGNISKEILIKYEEEKKYYQIGEKKNYNSELINDVVNIFVEEEKIFNGENNE